MEYEIESEHALFDRSTNPSLDHAPHKAAGNRRDERKTVRIPEEERETQIG